MREVSLPPGHLPYILYNAEKSGRRKPTPPQQRILEQMREGVWYESEIGKDRLESCRALVVKGWCELARVARKGKDGNLVELSFEDMLLESVMGRFIEQPCEMYRIANAQK